MIARFALLLLEWSAAGLAVAAGVSAAGTGAFSEIAVAVIAASVAGTVRAIAISRVAGRRYDALLTTLRSPPRPSNDV